MLSYLVFIMGHAFFTCREDDDEEKGDLTAAVETELPSPVRTNC